MSSHYLTVVSVPLPRLHQWLDGLNVRRTGKGILLPAPVKTCLQISQIPMGRAFSKPQHPACAADTALLFRGFKILTHRTMHSIEKSSHSFPSATVCTSMIPLPKVAPTYCNTCQRLITVIHVYIGLSLVSVAAGALCCALLCQLWMHLGSLGFARVARPAKMIHGHLTVESPVEVMTNVCCVGTKTRSRKVLKRISCGGLRPDSTLPSAREAKLLGSLRHPFIVRFLGSFLDNEDFCIITDYCEGGDLYYVIQQQREKSRPFLEPHIIEWFIQLLLGVSYLHERLVLHRDLKTKNLFLKNGTVKIGDFGVSRILSLPTDLATSFTGTPHYMSPETFSNSGYNAKSDVWSLGCILYEICSFRYAFEASNWIKLVSLIVEGPTPSLPSRYSSELNDILQKTLRKNPEERPSASEILHMPYILERGKVLSTWLEEVMSQDGPGSASEDASRIASAMQEKLHLDSLHAMRHVQDMAPRQRRRIRNEEPRESYPRKMKRAVERLYQENHQRLEHNKRADVNIQEDPLVKDDSTWISEDSRTTNTPLKNTTCTAAALWLVRPKAKLE
uniref:non-specific serine/threonine protein kinase n=1 Tax=Leptobrachium leishanense TaxID=445787 RepID=A0A8C5R3X8_9ANUR